MIVSIVFALALVAYFGTQFWWLRAKREAWRIEKELASADKELALAKLIAMTKRFNDLQEAFELADAARVQAENTLATRVAMYASMEKRLVEAQEREATWRKYADQRQEALADEAGVVLKLRKELTDYRSAYLRLVRKVGGKGSNNKKHRRALIAETFVGQDQPEA